MTRYIFEPEVMEAEWLDLSNGNLWPVWRSMPHPEGWKGPDRKKLLLVAFLMRQIADQLTYPESLAVIEVGERYADGPISQDEMGAADNAAYEIFDTVEPPNEAVASALNATQRYLYEQNETAEILVDAAGSRAAHLVGGGGLKAEVARHEGMEAMKMLIQWLINEVHGNPFRPVTFDSDWRTSTAVALAKQMYDSRDFSAMPILADALQDAGCDNYDILNHCRDASGTHVRGCWVVDLVLGKS